MKYLLIGLMIFIFSPCGALVLANAYEFTNKIKIDGCVNINHEINALHDDKNNTILALLLESIRLVHYDIYDCTKSYVYTTKKKASGNIIITTYFPEANSLADQFFKNGFFDLPFSLAIAANITVAMMLNNVDSQLSKIYLAGLNIAEVFAIYSWRVAKPDIQINTLIYAQEF